MTHSSRTRTAGVAVVALSAALLGPVGLAAVPAQAAVRCDPTAPDRVRVDLKRPVFSNPTRITNPLFPITHVTQVLQLGAEGDVALRHEVTLLRETKTIAWRGERIKTVVSQFMAYGDGRILEEARDYFAQADDGSVWYLGEDVDNYEDGVIANHDGTWLAGRDGTAGMIMPANPKVGNVYRPENIPGLVFEQVRVQATGVSLPGPRGVVRGAVRVQECLLDSTVEDKVFAPGYGEFRAEVVSSDELVNVAVAVPTDSLRGALPAALATLSSGALKVFDAVPGAGWDAIANKVEGLEDAWEDAEERKRPPLLAARMDLTLKTLEVAVEARRPNATRQAALAVAHAALDLQTQFRTPAAVDRDRVVVWQRQLRLDSSVGNSAGVAGDRAVISAIQDRLPQ